MRCVRGVCGRKGQQCSAENSELLTSTGVHLFCSSLSLTRWLFAMYADSTAAILSSYGKR